MIRMLLDGMLTRSRPHGCRRTGSIEEALTLAKEGEFDVASDVSISTASRSPVVEVLIRGGLPFVFASG